MLHWGNLLKLVVYVALVVFVWYMQVVVSVVVSVVDLVADLVEA